MDSTKKISFSFSKSTKQPIIFTPKSKENKDIELIDCLEGQSIKIKDAVEEIKAPLIIPLRDDAKDLLDRVRQSRQIRNNKDEIVDKKPESELTLDELAAKQLIEESKKQTEDITETKVHTLPVVVDKVLPQNNKESTIEDYENVPINDYGLAMLRGMGWSEITGIGKQNKQVTKSLEPELRPKGMGLGADKSLIVKKTATPIDENGKELSLVKGAYAKIVAGQHKGNYCEVLGLDDDDGRVIVKTTIKQLTLSLNEFLVQPVTKNEYMKNSKVLNNATYEEYKKKIGVSNEKIIDKVSNKTDGKRFDSKYNASTSSDNQRSKNKIKDLSPEGRHSKKRRDRSESPHSTQHKSRHKSRSPSRKQSKKHRRASESPDGYPSRNRKNSDSSDGADYKDRKFNGNKEETKKKKKKKKSKKHRKYQDSDSTDEEYRKKKKRKKSKKYSSDSSEVSGSSMEVDRFGRSRNKHRISKNDR